MIWFACGKCGKKQERPDAQAGSLVFCTCGQANRVPWESTVPAPEQPEPRPVPAGPRGYDPPRDEPRYPAPRRPAAPRSWDDRPQRQSGYCFNHQEVASEQTCADCGETFCPGCLATYVDQQLCGPCKNYRVRRLHAPGRLSVYAIVTLVLGLCGGPTAFVITIFAFASEQMSGSVGAVLLLNLIAVVLPLIVVGLGIMALRDIDTKPRVRGRSLAIIGLMAGMVTLVWSVTVTLIVVFREVIG